MTTFLFLIFLFLMQPAFQLTDSETFLIYNENLQLCLKLQQSHSFSLEICNKHSDQQNFKWVSDYQLLNMAVRLCLSVPSNKNMIPVTVSPCNKTLNVQKWECRNDTLALATEELFLNPSNGHENGVILSANVTKKSVWKIYRTKKNLCTQKYEALFTIEGNAFGAPCVFPFKYLNKWYDECVLDSDHQRLWCGTTSDVDKDSLFGYCPIKDKNDNFFWTKNHWTGDLYQINSHSTLTWDEARKSCQQQMSELLSINELHEQAYLTGLTQSSEANYWIGLYNPDFDSGWQWINDQPLKYLNWAPGSPSSETGKTCGLFQSRNGKWENDLCDLKHGYICKRMNSSMQASTPSSDDLKPVKCPEGWVGYAKHCYRLNRDRKTWKDASVSCQKDGGHLLSIRDIEEYSFVFSQLGYKATDNLWIGLNDQKVSSSFEWSDGTTVSFIKWQKGEPTLISNVQEDCVIMTGKNGYMADHFCEEELGYICKKESSEFLPGTDEVADPKCQKGWKRYGFYCYLIGKTLGTFSEAKASCETNQGFLISVENRFEQAFLTSQIGHRPEKYFWIGLSDVENPGTFNWINGDPIQFTHWNAKMPGRNPGCVAMRTGDAAGLWDVVNCEERAPFLCKHLAEGVTLPTIPGPTPPLPCSTGWTASPTRNVCFKAYAEKKSEKTWFEAHAFCKSIGGDLASFHNKQEFQLLNQLLNYRSSWIGLRIVDSSPEYTWSDGSPVNYEPILTWYSESENNERCKLIWGNTRFWTATRCRRLQYWICQITKGLTIPTDQPVDNFENSYIKIEDGWIRYENNEYYFSKKTMPAEKARKFCKQHHGDLTTIDSKEENNFLWKYIFYHRRYYNSYIGLILDLDKKFSWMDGSPVTYEAWASGEPNFANDDENCVAMYYYSGDWNDINCGIEKTFICERHNSSVRSTAAPTLPATPKGCSEGWLWFNDKCFQMFGFVEEEKKNWSDARAHCRNLGGNLASIPSKNVQAFLTVQLKSASGNTWIGLTDKNWYGHFVWTDGSGVYFTNWAKGSPRSYHGDCVFMVTKPERLAGYWRVGSCSSKMTYICQKNTGPEPYSEPTVPASHYISYGNSSYSMVGPKMTWEEARKKCESENSKLATISDPYAESFIWLQVLRNKEPVWIGLSSEVSNPGYKWISKRRLAYTNWAAEEPRNNTACVYLDIDGYWKTGNFSEKHVSVCERYNGIISTERPQSAGKCQTSKNRDEPWIPFGDYCYKFYVSRESWPKAALTCNLIGGTLTSIKDSAELHFLKEEMEIHGSMEFWIGLYSNHEGEWLWQDKSNVAFVNWNNQDDDRENDRTETLNSRCIYMNSKSGLWFESYCGSYTSRSFICKRNKIIEESAVNPTKTVQKRVAPLPTHGTAVGLVIPVILIIIGAGIAAYIFYRRRNRPQQVSAGFDNSLYKDNVIILHKDSQSLADNEELN
ncbi:macrophage mannose receptor 1-like [Pantherophis guttatus]|uniref:Macrophage mannose receptor 1-like n=1 Tax=Pantherophis guttatus TaxID=94885 RepID=A0A6P9AK75_PANGU|nr:macrophage mannose receptor 1-like [Pantherophis guttatus]